MELTTQKPAIKQGWLRAIAIFIPWVISYGAFSTLGYFLIQKMELSKGYNLILPQLFGLIGTFLITWIFIKFIDKKPFYTLGFVKRKMGEDIFLGITIGFVMMALGFYILKYFGQIEIESIQIDYLKLFIGILLFIVVAINEELILRGYMLNNFMDSMPRYWALLVSSLIFASLHLGNANIDAIGFGNIILAGFLLGISYTYTKSLWFPIALHFSWNFFQGSIFGYAVSGNETYSLIKQTRTADTIWNGGKFGFEASITAIIFLVIFIFIIAKYYANQTKKIA
jgi:membrane protease YdiL (CAAX protease family)